MVVAWSNHCCSEPCSWVPHRTHSVIDTNTPFSWSSSSHMSTFSSTTSSNSCSGPSLRYSPPSSPVTLYLPPHLSTYPPVNLPSTARGRSHLFTLAPYTEANRISEEVDSSLKCEVDDHPRVSPGHPSTSTNYQRVNYNPGVSVPKGGPVPPLFHNSNAPPRSIGLSPSHKKVTYKGGIISPERAPTPQTRGSGPPATTESDELGAYWQLLDDDLKPTMPQPSCSHSQQIFNEHKELAHQLLVVQEEIVYLDKEKSRMLKKLEEQDREQHACRQRYSDKINQLKSKNESLRQDHSRLSQQLEEITRRQKGSQQNTQQQQQQQQERSTSNQHYIQQPSSNNPISSPFSPHHIQNQAFHHYHDPQQYSPQRQLPLSHQYYYDNPLHPLFPHNMQNH